MALKSAWDRDPDLHGFCSTADWPEVCLPLLLGRAGPLSLQWSDQDQVDPTPSLLVLRSLPTFPSPDEGAGPFSESPWDRSFRREMSSGLKVGIGGCKLLRAHNHSTSTHLLSPAVQASVLLVELLTAILLPVSSSDRTPGAQGSGSPP